MSSPETPSPATGESEPGPPPSLPGSNLWGDSDPPGRTDATAIDPTKEQSRALPTIGHIGRYALKYQLGEGGLGTVFAAHDPLLSRLIAVKTLNVEVREEEREAFNALFLNEARAAGGLSHPHIVTVFDAGISDKRAYIAMELLKGRDLRQLRQEGWRATPAQAALIVRRVADALAFAHSKGVIHRDIKPANIFMVGRTQPRVLDFGIARVAHQRDGSDPHSGAGSPYYMAPEQVRCEPTDRRADVFSLGVVLYELLTDQKPFRGESLKQIQDAVLSLEPPLAHKLDESVPKALAQIAARAMAKDPEQRFRSARSFARELRQWIDENPATPEGDLVPSAPPPGRLRLVWGAAASVVVAVAAGLLHWQGLLLPDGHDGAGAAHSGAGAAPAPAPAILAAPIPAPAAAASEMPLAAPSIEVGSLAAAPAEPAASSVAVEKAIVAPAAIAAPPAATLAPGASGSTATARDAAKEKRLRDPREARERETRERDQRQAAALSLAAPPTGTVKLAITPWGNVEVDGAPTGAAPPLNELTLAEGRHQIVVRNGDFPPFTTYVNVAAGQTVALRYKFGF